MNIEEHNYWNDHRVRASMINKGEHVEEDGRNYLVVEQENGDLRLLCKWGVCPTCDGDGSHVNPSIDASGLTAEDFAEDPDFAESYISGMYNQTCNECNGLRVVPVVDRSNNSSELVARYEEHMKSEYEYAAEVAAERRMGA